MREALAQLRKPDDASRLEGLAALDQMVKKKPGSLAFFRIGAGHAQAGQEEDGIAALEACLVERLGDGSAKVRSGAALLLGKIGPLATQSIEVLGQAVADSDRIARLRAVVALGSLGETAQSQTPVLCNVVRGGDRDMAQLATRALKKIGATDGAVLMAVKEGIRLHGNAVALDATEVLRAGGAAGAPHLVSLLQSPNHTIRHHAASSLRRLETIPEALLPDLLDAIEKGGKSIADEVSEAICKVRPDPMAVVPRVLPLLDSKDKDTWFPVHDVLRHHSASMTREQLLQLLPASKGSATGWIVYRLKDRGIDDELADTLRDMAVSEDSFSSPAVLRALRNHPSHAKVFLRRHGIALPYLRCEEIMEILSEQDPSFAELKQEIISHHLLPTPVMVRLGYPKFLPTLRARMADADPHTMKYLRACARSLGDPPKRVVQISSRSSVDLRPASLHPGVDRKRYPATGFGHVDGRQEVIITGKILMVNRAAAVAPTVKTAGFLLSRPLSFLRHSPTTGRFTLIISVSAAYAPYRKGLVSGPYQTHSKEVVFGARGAKPLKVTLYDEMPDLEIVLDPIETDGLDWQAGDEPRLLRD
jgi:HEAT repeat protein